MHRLLYASLTLSCLAMLSGCSSGTPKPPERANVSGTVTMNGKPMAEGEIQFEVTGQPPQVLQIKAGAFAGEVFVGKNRVGLMQMADGPPNPTSPGERIKVNKVSARFYGAATELSADVTASGASDLKFAVTGGK